MDRNLEGRLCGCEVGSGVHGYARNVGQSTAYPVLGARSAFALFVCLRAWQFGKVGLRGILFNFGVGEIGRNGGSYSLVGLGVFGRFGHGMPMRCGLGGPAVAPFGLGFGAAGAFVFEWCEAGGWQRGPGFMF